MDSRYPEVLSSSSKFLTTDFAILPQSAFARNPMHLHRGGIAQRIRLPLALASFNQDMTRKGKDNAGFTKK
jgi:hypothetical protein